MCVIFIYGIFQMARKEKLFDIKSLPAITQFKDSKNEHKNEELRQALYDTNVLYNNKLGEMQWLFALCNQETFYYNEFVNGIKETKKVTEYECKNLLLETMRLIQSANDNYTSLGTDSQILKVCKDLFYNLFIMKGSNTVEPWVRYFFIKDTDSTAFQSGISHANVSNKRILAKLREFGLLPLFTSFQDAKRQDYNKLQIDKSTQQPSYNPLFETSLCVSLRESVRSWHALNNLYSENMFSIKMEYRTMLRGITKDNNLPLIKNIYRACKNNPLISINNIRSIKSLDKILKKWTPRMSYQDRLNVIIDLYNKSRFKNNFGNINFYNWLAKDENVNLHNYKLIDNYLTLLSHHKKYNKASSEYSSFTFADPIYSPYSPDYEKLKDKSGTSLPNFEIIDYFKLNNVKLGAPVTKYAKSKNINLKELVKPNTLFVFISLFRNREDGLNIESFLIQLGHHENFTKTQCYSRNKVRYKDCHGKLIDSELCNSYISYDRDYLENKIGNKNTPGPIKFNLVLDIKKDEYQDLENVMGVDIGINPFAACAIVRPDETIQYTTEIILDGENIKDPVILQNRKRIRSELNHFIDTFAIVKLAPSKMNEFNKQFSKWYKTFNSRTHNDELKNSGLYNFHGGLSWWYIEFLMDLRNLLVSMSEYGKDKAGKDRFNTTVTKKLNKKIKNLRELRIKTGVSKIFNLAIKNKCKVILMEDLENYKPNVHKSRIENKMHSKWSKRLVLKSILRKCDTCNIEIKQIPANYSSKFLNINKAPGARYDKIPPSFFDSNGIIKDGIKTYLLEKYSYMTDEEVSALTIDSIIPSTCGKIFISKYKGRLFTTQADINAALNLCRGLKEYTLFNKYDKNKYKFFSKTHFNNFVCDGKIVNGENEQLYFNLYHRQKGTSKCPVFKKVGHNKYELYKKIVRWKIETKLTLPTKISVCRDISEEFRNSNEWIPTGEFFRDIESKLWKEVNSQINNFNYEEIPF